MKTFQILNLLFTALNTVMGENCTRQAWLYAANYPPLYIPEGSPLNIIFIQLIHFRFHRFTLTCSGVLLALRFRIVNKNGNFVQPICFVNCGNMLKLSPVAKLCDVLQHLFRNAANKNVILVVRKHCVVYSRRSLANIHLYKKQIAVDHVSIARSKRSQNSIKTLTIIPVIFCYHYQVVNLQCRIYNRNETQKSSIASGV